jgi:hypothetical protein
MAEHFSTGLRNYMLQKGSFRECFDDAVIKIYDGSIPATADVAATGTLLVTLTKSSGTVSAGEVSQHNTWAVAIPDTHAAADTYALTITMDSVAVTKTYTNTPDAGTSEQVITAAALYFNEEFAQIDFVALTGLATRTIAIKNRVGMAMTIVDGGGSVTFDVATGALGEVAAAARSDALSFGTATSGVIAKTSSETWSGVVAASGTASYFRLVRSDDTAALSTTEERLQGTVATSGAEINASSTSLTAASTLTLDTFTVTFPES